MAPLKYLLTPPYSYHISQPPPAAKQSSVLKTKRISTVSGEKK